MAAGSAWLMIAVVMVAEGLVSAQESQRSIPGYSLEEISRNFRDSVAKAVEQRLHKGGVVAESQTTRTVVPKVAPVPKAIPAVVQPVPEVKIPVHIMHVAPQPQVRVMQVVPQVHQEHHGQFFMDVRNGQVFLEQTRQVPNPGQFFQHQRNVPLPTGQVFVNPNLRAGEVFPTPNYHPVPQAVLSQAEYTTRQVFAERHHQENQIPVQVVQEPVVIQTVKAAPRKSIPSVKTVQEIVRPQEFEAVREVPKVVPQVSQVARSQPAPVIRQRVQNHAQVKEAEVISERFGVPVANETDDEDFYKQAQDAHYSFSSGVQDGINDNHQTREEERDGLNLRGRYSYSDGFFKRTVHYEADEKGYRVTKQEVEPLGDGPRINPEGVAEVNTSLGGSYSITAQEIKDVREAEKEGQKLV